MLDRRTAVGLIALALVPLTTAANQQVPASETIQVQVTNLDVVVTDSKGNAVRGLTAADFEVLENGQKKAVTNFTEVARGETTEIVAQPAPRRVLLLVDNGSVELAARRKMIDGARAALEGILFRPSDRLMIASISRSITPRLAWTGNRAEIDKALAEIEKDAILPKTNLIAIERMIEKMIENAEMAAGGGMPGQLQMPPATAPDPNAPAPPPRRGGQQAGRGVAVSFRDMITAAREYAGAARSEERMAIGAIQASLQFFEPGPERKIVILVGGGLPTKPGWDIFQRLETVRQKAELGGPGDSMSNIRDTSPLMAASEYDVNREITALARSAKARGIAFYPTNPEFAHSRTSGVESRRMADQVAEFSTTAGMVDGYQLLAKSTGGVALVGAAAEVAYSQIRRDLDSYYSLGYRSDAPPADAKIEVRMKKGLSARATLSGGRLSKDLEVEDRVLANHVSDPPSNDMSIAVMIAGEPVSEGDRRKVPLRILIPVNSIKMVRDGDDVAGSLQVFVSMGDKQGNASDPQKQMQQLRWPAAQFEQMKGKTMALNIEVTLEPGRDQISVGVLDMLSDKTGFSRWTPGT